MELKVHVDNKVRIVSGLDKDTTVQDIIIALAFSLKQTGRFYLFEKFVYLDEQSLRVKRRKAKRLPRIMAPTEKPLQVLTNYMDYLEDDEYIEFHLIKSNIDPLIYFNINQGQIVNDLMDKLNNGENFLANSLEKSKTTSSSSNNQKLFNNQIITEQYAFINSIEGESKENFKDNIANSQNTSLSSCHENATNSNSCSSIDERNFNGNLSNANTILNEISQQQLMLQNQSSKMKKLLKKIEKYELAKLQFNQMQQQQQHQQEKINSLELIYNLNLKTLKELERENTALSLSKQMEINEYLRAQKNYLERKIDDVEIKLTTQKNLSKNLENDMEKIRKERFSNDSLISSSSSSMSLSISAPYSATESSASSFNEFELINMNNNICSKQKQQMLEENNLLEDFNKSIKNFKINKFRINYLETKWSKIENEIETKRQMIDMLEKECMHLEENALNDKQQTLPTPSSSSSDSIFLNFKNSCINHADIKWRESSSSSTASSASENSLPLFSFRVKNDKAKTLNRNLKTRNQQMSSKMNKNHNNHHHNLIQRDNKNKKSSRLNLDNNLDYIHYF